MDAGKLNSVHSGVKGTWGPWGGVGGSSVDSFPTVSYFVLDVYV